MDYTKLVLAVGVVGIAAYFVVNATQSNECTGSFFDYINPACLLSGATSEINTLVIVIALVIIVVIGLLAFGPSGAHLATTGAALL